ncbi:hypothetical protein HK405_001843, partial [Cladochytrium tenue]
AVSRLILSGAFDKYPGIKLLLAHSGGTLPFLAGRLDSCVEHDPQVAERLAHPPSTYLRRLLYDAVAYHPAALLSAAHFVGWDRLMFGTDHPFFPPVSGEAAGAAAHAQAQAARWRSVDSNLEAIAAAAAAAGAEEGVVAGVLGGNALREILPGSALN